MEEAPNEVSITISEIASDKLDVPMAQLPPLTHAINPDALNELLNDNPGSGFSITFQYTNLQFIIYSKDMVYARPVRDNSSQFRKDKTPFWKDNP